MSQLIEIECLDYAGSGPEVIFRFNGIDMSADLDPGVVRPVVMRGTAVGFSEEVEFTQYRELQKAINVFVAGSGNK